MFCNDEYRWTGDVKKRWFNGEDWKLEEETENIEVQWEEKGQRTLWVCDNSKLKENDTTHDSMVHASACLQRTSSLTLLLTIALSSAWISDWWLLIQMKERGKTWWSFMCWLFKPSCLLFSYKCNKARMYYSPYMHNVWFLWLKFSRLKQWKEAIWCCEVAGNHGINVNPKL